MDHLMNEHEVIVNLEWEAKNYIIWTWMFWIVTAVIGAVGILAQLYPSIILEDETLVTFNAKFPILMAILVIITLFFGYATYLTQKRLGQGFTHYQKTYFKDEN